MFIEINKYADVHSAEIGNGTRIWPFCLVFSGAIIGANCNVCANVLIESDVIIKKRGAAVRWRW